MNNMIHKYRNINIYYEPHLDGDGRVFYPEFQRIIKERIGKVNIIYEYCAGPAFIGFSLLEDKMCKKLVLSDIVLDSVECCKKTIKENKLNEKVSLYLSDCLKQIPLQKWDLVVSNPPHFSKEDNFGFRENGEPTKSIISLDKNWEIHKNFYMNIKKYLNKGGLTLFVENGRGSCPELFKEMIKEGGLKYIDTIKCNLNRPSRFYFTLAKKESN